MLINLEGSPSLAFVVAAIVVWIAGTRLSRLANNYLSWLYQEYLCLLRLLPFSMLASIQFCSLFFSWSAFAFLTGSALFTGSWSIKGT